jgi:hypothetical protein
MRCSRPHDQRLKLAAPGLGRLPFVLQRTFMLGLRPQPRREPLGTNDRHDHTVEPGEILPYNWQFVEFRFADGRRVRAHLVDIDPNSVGGEDAPSVGIISRVCCAEQVRNATEPARACCRRA